MKDDEVEGTTMVYRVTAKVELKQSLHGTLEFVPQVSKAISIVDDSQGKDR